MTIIAAAITKQDGVVIAADSEISWDFTKADDGPNKLWVDKERKFIFGGAGGYRSGQVIKHWTEWPEFREHHHDVEMFMVKEVVPAIKSSLSENGAMRESKGLETSDAIIIMAWGNNLVVVEEDFSVIIPPLGRWAIGSGQSEAFGSMGDEGPWTKNDVIKAAKVATKTAVGVGGEVYYVTSKGLEVKKAS